MLLDDPQDPSGKRLFQVELPNVLPGVATSAEEAEQLTQLWDVLLGWQRWTVKCGCSVCIRAHAHIRTNTMLLCTVHMYCMYTYSVHNTYVYTQYICTNVCIHSTYAHTYKYHVTLYSTYVLYVYIQWTLTYPDFTYPAARIIRTPNFPGIAICTLVVSFLALVVYNNRCTCVLSQQKNGYPRREA